eukprot:sb/3469919/
MMLRFGIIGAILVTLVCSENITIGAFNIQSFGKYVSCFVIRDSSVWLRHTPFDSQIGRQCAQIGSAAPDSDSLAWKRHLTKYSRTQIRGYLVDIVTKYDVILIQEIKDKSQTMIWKFLADCQAVKSTYDMALSIRLGRTTRYMEQYAIIYDTSLITMDNHTVYSDPTDVFHREPIVAQISLVSGNVGEMVSHCLCITCDFGSGPGSIKLIITHQKIG